MWLRNPDGGQWAGIFSWTTLARGEVRARKALVENQRTGDARDRSITFCSSSFKSGDQQMALFARGTSSQNDQSPVLGSGLFRTPYVPHSFPRAASSFDHGSKVVATETSRQSPLLAECDHRGHESCEGALEPNTNQGGSWLHQYPSNDCQGMFLLSNDIF